MISAFKYGWMNPWWAFKKDSNDNPKQIFNQATNNRSQDLESLYCPTGAIWFAKTDLFLKSKDFYGPDFKMIDIDWKHAIDIDNYEDLEMAEIIYKVIQNRRSI